MMEEGKARVEEEEESFEGGRTVEEDPSRGSEIDQRTK